MIARLHRCDVEQFSGVRKLTTTDDSSANSTLSGTSIRTESTSHAFFDRLIQYAATSTPTCYPPKTTIEEADRLGTMRTDSRLSYPIGLKGNQQCDSLRCGPVRRHRAPQSQNATTCRSRLSLRLSETRYHSHSQGQATRKAPDSGTLSS